MALAAEQIAHTVDSLVGEGVSKEMGIGGAYEGAEKYSKMLGSWAPPIRSADDDIGPDKNLADARVRDMTRNDGYAQSAANIHKDNIVGAMYMLNAKPQTTVLSGLKGDTKWAEEFQEEVEAKFTLCAESPNCWFDASHNQTLTGIIRLATGIYAQTGEFLATAAWITDYPRPYKTAIQMIDLDRLATPWEFMDDPSVVSGVRKTRRGASRGFYIRKGKNRADMFRDPVDDFTYVKARKPNGRVNAIHIKEQMRVDQTRGVADMVAGLKEMKTLSTFRDVTLQNAVVNAMYAASIESDLPPEVAMAALGAGNPGEQIAKYGSAYLGAIAKYTGENNMKVDGVKIPHFYPGTSLKLNPVGNPGGVGQEFETGLLRYISALLGVSYEQLSRDYSNTNYSSARAGMLETWKFMQSRKKMVADRLATIIYTLWFEEAMNMGDLEVMKYSKAPNFYEGLNREAYTNCSWIGASRGQIDELKETQAAVLRMKYNLSTQEDEAAKLGKDWRRLNEQLEREKLDREDKGLELEESNAINAASGAPREASNDENDAAEVRGEDG